MMKWMKYLTVEYNALILCYSHIADTLHIESDLNWWLSIVNLIMLKEIDLHDLNYFKKLYSFDFKLSCICIISVVLN